VKQSSRLFVCALFVLSFLTGATANSEPNTNGDKSSSPTTNLGNYPKYPSGPVGSAGKVDTGPHKDVESSRVLPNGVTEVVSYTPAVGVSPESLAEKLKAQGVPNVQVKQWNSTSGWAGGDWNDGVGTQADPNSCYYFTAANTTCPISYWSNGGYNNPIVRINDHSSASWPVNTVAYRWNQANGIDTWYYWNNCPFMAGARCIDVFSGFYPRNGFCGTTFKYYYGSVHHGRFREPEPGMNFRVELNDSYNTTECPRASLACHELGHVLGLAHNIGAAGTSCMRVYETTSWPGSDDYTMLGINYSVYRSP
jgi:hypothetical protein